MSTQNVNATPTTSQKATEIAPFNPFAHLNADDNAALVTRLNAQWKTAKDGEIRIASNELKCSTPEAAIYVWLRELATDQLETQAYNRIFSSHKAMLEQVGAGSMASLALMAEDYPKLPQSMTRKYRINLRDQIVSKWHGETAERILAKIMDATGVVAVKEWMR